MNPTDTKFALRLRRRAKEWELWKLYRARREHDEVMSDPRIAACRSRGMSSAASRAVGSAPETTPVRPGMRFGHTCTNTCARTAGPR
jgi:hypothetical protein